MQSLDISSTQLLGVLPQGTTQTDTCHRGCKGGLKLTLGAAARSQGYWGFSKRSVYGPRGSGVDSHP